MWNPFRRRGKEPEQPTPAAPAAPTAPEEKPRGFRQRLTDRFRPKARREREKPPAAPAAPPAPPAPPEKPPAPEREYPKGIGVSAAGVWQISSTEWDGVMHGSLHGDDVAAFIDAMEAGDHQTAAELVAKAYDENVGNLIDVSRSEIHRIGYV